MQHELGNKGLTHSKARREKEETKAIFYQTVTDCTEKKKKDACSLYRVSPWACNVHHDSLIVYNRRRKKNVIPRNQLHLHPAVEPRILPFTLTFTAGSRHQLVLHLLSVGAGRGFFFPTYCWCLGEKNPFQWIDHQRQGAGRVNVSTRLVTC